MSDLDERGAAADTPDTARRFGAHPSVDASRLVGELFPSAQSQTDRLRARELRVSLGELIRLTECLGSDGLLALCLYLAHLELVPDDQGEPVAGVPRFSAAWLQRTSGAAADPLGVVPLGKNAAARAQQAVAQSGLLVPRPSHPADEHAGALGRTWRGIVDQGRLEIEAPQAAVLGRRNSPLRGRPRTAEVRRRRPGLHGLQESRQKRRDSAAAPLASGGGPKTWWEQHAGYQIHLIEREAFKIGISRRSSQPIRQLGRWSGSVVLIDHVIVDNRCLAEMIEEDVVSAVEPWHQLGDPLAMGSGYTELWSDRGPTVDLRAVAARVVTTAASGP